MRVDVLDHPLVATQITELRSETTSRSRFRELVNLLTRSLVFAASAELSTRPKDVTTPMEPTSGVVVDRYPLLVPILRAGLGMLHPALEVLPESGTGFLGLRRDETTLQPSLYMNTLPRLDGAPVFLLDPMLATGGSAQAAASITDDHGAGPITLIALLAAPEGIDALDRQSRVDRLVTAAVDRELNEHGFILPGLGDAGDRQFGTQ